MDVVAVAKIEQHHAQQMALETIPFEEGVDTGPHFVHLGRPSLRGTLSRGPTSCFPVDGLVSKLSIVVSATIISPKYIVDVLAS